MATVSIIVPVYNVEPYLRRCVDSILAQTFTDFELILVDDGSPDGCPRICDEYAAADSRIRVIHKENGGLSSARNAGMKIAQGQYLLFCDSDDYVSSNWCQVMLSAIEEHPQALIASDVLKVSESKAQIPTEPACCKDATRISLFQLYSRGLSGYVCNKIFRRDIIANHGLMFDEGRKFAEDVPFVMAYCDFCDSYVLVDAPVYYYVQRTGSILHSVRWDVLEHQLFTFYIRIPYLDPEDIPAYCDGNLYSFIHYFDAVFVQTNTASFLSKMRYNQRMLSSREFQYCLEHATGKKESPLFMRVLRTRNYYVFWLFNQLINLKQKLRRK